ncbi:MAG: hypothetical protein WCR46_06715 [Deltaproteobacteria bacterium]
MIPWNCILIRHPMLQRAKTTEAYGYLLKPVLRWELAATIASFFCQRVQDRGKWGMIINV